MSLARLKSRTPGPAEFVNAVLRAFTRAPAPAAGCPRDPVEAAGVRCSFPDWLAARWIARYGREDADALMRALTSARRSPSARTRCASHAEALAARLRDEELADTGPTSLAPEGLVEPGRRRPLARLRRGLVHGAGRGLDAGGAAPRSAAGRRGGGRLRRARHEDHPPRRADGQPRPIVAFDPQPARLKLVTRRPRGSASRSSRRTRAAWRSGAPLDGPLRPRARRRAVLEPGRAAPESGGEVAARGDGPRPARGEAAQHPRRRGRDGRSPAAASSTPPARSSPRRTRRSSRLPRRASRLACRPARRPSRCRSTRAAWSASCRTATAPTASPRSGWPAAAALTPFAAPGAWSKVGA